MAFHEVSYRDITTNPFEDFGKNWMALAAGNQQIGSNAMTIAWGHLGSLWERGTHTNRLPTAICYVRPSRYTKKLMDSAAYFTLSSFDAQHRHTLGYLGTHSGCDGEKYTAAGLTPVFAENTVYFSEAQRVYICRKLYSAKLQEVGFADRELMEFNYPQRDFHTMYIGEIIKVLETERSTNP